MGWGEPGYLLKQRQISHSQISIQLGIFLGNFRALRAQARERGVRRAGGRALRRALQVRAVHGGDAAVPRAQEAAVRVEPRAPLHQALAAGAEPEARGGAQGGACGEGRR